MSLFEEQDYSPKPLSPRWLAIKCRPNMLLNARSYIVAILESGLLFREDSATVEQLEVEWGDGGGGGWMTRGEGWTSAAAVLAAVVVVPPTVTLSGRGVCARVCLYTGCALAVQARRRVLTRSCLSSLLECLAAYTVLARKTLVCIKEYGIVKRDIECMSSMTESATQLLWRQHNTLVTLLARCSLALLTNVPWLRHEAPWQIAECRPEPAELTKIHHSLLVMQSLFLTQVAMAHFVQPKASRKLFGNHNERIYWLHMHLLQHLYEEVKENQLALERMYRLLKNCRNNDSVTVKKGIALNDSWLYSDVHAGVARATIELKMATTKCAHVDVFLDNCETQKGNFDVEALNNDLDGLVDAVTVCLTTLQNSQIKLKKIQSRMNPNKIRYDTNIEDQHPEDETSILKIEDKDPESKDEVFYFVKTEEDNNRVDSTVDVTTGPGKKERDTTKIVLGELKRKLVKREDIMRQREKVALERTMPEFKGRVPDFPRQIQVELEETAKITKGFVSKIMYNKNHRKTKVSKSMKRSARRIKYKKIKKISKFILKNNYKNNKIATDIEFNLSHPKHRNIKDTVTLTAIDKRYIITRWVKINEMPIQNDFASNCLSDGLSDIEDASYNKINHHAVDKNIDYKPVSPEAKIAPNNEKFRKEDLDLSSSDSDLELNIETEEQISTLKDIRRHRAARKKNHPVRPRLSMEKEANSDCEIMDEGLRPVEYSFGTGMALASVFQGLNGPRLPNVGAEEVFIGDGEVSNDSGNDEDS